MIKSISMGVEEESLDFELNITSFLFEEQIDDKLEVNSLFSRSTVGAKPASHKFEFIPSSSDGHKENLMFLHYQEGKPFNPEANFVVGFQSNRVASHEVNNFNTFSQNNNRIENSRELNVLKKLSSVECLDCCLDFDRILFDLGKDKLKFDPILGFPYCVGFQFLDRLYREIVLKLAYDSGYQSDGFSSDSIVRLLANYGVRNNDRLYLYAFFYVIVLNWLILEGYCGDTRILLDTMLPQSIFLWTEFMLARETKYWVAQNIFDQSLVGNISFTVHMEEVQECFVTSTSNSSQNLLNCISVKVGGLCYTSARSGKYFCDSPVLARTLFDRGKLFEAINRYSYHTTSNSHLSFGILIFSLLEVIRRYSCYVKCSSKSFLDTLSSCVFFILWKILKDEYNGDSFYELILQHGYQLDSRLINSITFVLVEECDNFYDRNLFAELSYRYSITSHGGGHILCLLEERIFTGKVLWLLLVVVSLEQL
ncbi:uncharacterized protein LOC113349033 isoform X2 [Papaver somniferum]|uniref:uncharacterized protein LOC113349033 isoform X2 n=1 Tax=Papaver somniferum TaxID=3469 RepID=UPI000E6FF028|nr:uncharacterized protein LOC113349033 isoform X2 [Papaver somniferum]